jgi:hypothetical protein
MSRKSYKSTRPKGQQAKQSSSRNRDTRSSFKRQEGLKSFKVGEIEYPLLVPEQIIRWLAETDHINEINDLTKWTDGTFNRIPCPPVTPTPIVGTTEQKKLKLSMDAVQNALAKEEREKHAIAYSLQFLAIPKVYQMAWSKGITSARELRLKIQTMCSYKKDTLLKLHYKLKLDRLTLRSNGLLDMNNYENSFVELVQDYIDAGGTITMDEQVAKLRVAIFNMSSSNPTYRREFVDCLLNDGPHMLLHPSTRGDGVSKIS